MATKYLCPGVTENPDLNAELTQVDAGLLTAIRAAISCLQDLDGREPDTTTVLDTELARLHGWAARITQYTHDRRVYAAKATSEVPQSRGVEVADIRTSRVRMFGWSK